MENLTLCGVKYYYTAGNILDNTIISVFDSSKTKLGCVVTDEDIAAFFDNDKKRFEIKNLELCESHLVRVFVACIIWTK